MGKKGKVFVRVLFRLLRQLAYFSVCLTQVSSLLLFGVDNARRSMLNHSQRLTSFSVLDSISMTHFVQPDEHLNESPPVSPDGKQFLIVTERGVIETNTREYSLFVYHISRTHAQPILVARFNSSSNRPGILDARWIDNEHISFIGENPGEVPGVYVANCLARIRHRLTSTSVSVAAYDISKDQHTLVYYASWAPAEANNIDKESRGFTITTELLTDLINGRWRLPAVAYQMYVRNLVTGHIQEVHEKPFFFNPGRLKIYLSPNGRYAISEQGPDVIPAIWSQYENSAVRIFAREYENKRFDIRDSALAEPMLLDTQTGKITTLINAPCSTNGLISVAWAADSRSAVIGNTSLPLDINDPAEFRRRKAHSAVADVKIPGGEIQHIFDIPEKERWEVSPSAVPSSFILIVYGKQESISRNATRKLFRHEADGWVEERNAPAETPVSDIAVEESLNDWPKLMEFDRSSGQKTVLLDPNPQFRQLLLAHEEVIHWTGKQGEAQIGGLYYPTNYMPGIRYPLVIQTHGFSPEEFRPDGSFTTAFAAQPLANKGVFVLQVGESDLEIAAKDTLSRGPATQSQIESAIDHLSGIGLIDRERVGLVGFSVSGFMVRYALFKSTYHFAAATSAEGNDWGYWTYIALGNFPAWAAQSEAPYGGPPWRGNWDPWIANSISFNYDKIHTPLRLESDSNDHGEVINEWENYFALKRLHKPVELFFVSHGAHPVVKPLDRLGSQQGNVDWMLFWLKNEEDPDPSKAEQYARWHALRKLQDETVQKQ